MAEKQRRKVNASDKKKEMKREGKRESERKKGTKNARNRRTARRCVICRNISNGSTFTQKAA